MRDEDKQFWLEDSDDVLRRRLKSSGLKPVVEPYKAPVVTDHKLMEFMVVKAWPQLRKIGVYCYSQLKRVRIPKKAPQLSKKAWVGVGAIILVLGVGGTALGRWIDKPVDVTTEVLGEETATAPEFETVAPEKTEATTPVKYDAKKKVANYADKIDGIDITVSQQQMPDSFKANPVDSVQKLAEQFSAKEKITAGDSVAYVGTSIKGPQSVITYKGDLLIFLYSQSKISNTSWGNYISQLR